MLCRSIATDGLEKILGLINGAEMAEIRIEKSGLNTAEIKQVFQSHPNLIATCRPDGLTNEQRMEFLITAIEGGAAWVDLEVESDKSFTEPLVELAHRNDCKVIISYHNYEYTPEISDLIQIIDNCHDKKADLVKLATQVNQTIDISNLLILYSYGLPILVLGMGVLGNITRLAALKMKAPFTYVSCDTEPETAPGQIKESDMKIILNIL